MWVLTFFKYFIFIAALIASTSHAAKYQIDTQGGHASIQFKVLYLGVGWLTGRFNTFDGHFDYNSSKPAQSNASVEIDMRSVDTNHSLRDKQLRSTNMLDTENHPTATFVSTAYKPTQSGKGVLSGLLTLRGVSKKVHFPVSKVGITKDQWGHTRVGFTGKTRIKLSHFGIAKNISSIGSYVEIELFIQGVAL